jgi:hypothetical protein
MYHTAMLILLGVTLVHLFFVGVLGKLPWPAGLILVVVFIYFVGTGLLKQS